MLCMMRKTFSMQRIFFVVFWAGFAVQAASQAYFTAAGLRLGTEWGLSVQHRFAKSWTGEAILQSGFSNDDVLFTILAERHFPLIVRNFNLYGGGGLHWAWSGDGRELYRSGGGLSLIGGVELSLGRLNLSYDLKPALTFSSYRPLRMHTALSVRYILIKGSVFRKQQRKKKRAKRRWPWEK